MAVYRIYVEKKKDYAVEAASLKSEISSLLGINGIKSLRIINRYDVEGISAELFGASVATVFSEPQLDDTYEELPKADYTFAVEYLPGQFDQRASSASECIQLISAGERPAVNSARVYLIDGALSSLELQSIKEYVINPVEAREAELTKKETLKVNYSIPTEVETLTGFTKLDKAGLSDFVKKYGLAMDTDDIAFCQKYFISERRDPTITEIRMIDTYWSDHCRHTTFGTIIDKVTIDNALVKKAYENYLSLRGELYVNKTKPVCLMDLGTIGGKYLKKKGVLKNLDESDEINACSVKIKVDNDGKEEDWLLLFKNETHNHPTEIEPFGGAATCIGGAIRDPLANRGYVYQAMRVTGAGNPLVPVSETLKGKLPQRKLVTTAAAGYSSYGNQIGLATGIVDELYHDGYIAKRMEIGAVVGAVREESVRREEPAEGDVVILLGGKTGRDGCGGATGSSKAHKLESLETCGAEVQKGNAPVERKLQRLFRTKEATLMIKRCNDFGAGGVSVAIGELADGLLINLDAVPKKYDGLDGTELAISESQERMAVVVAKEDEKRFIEVANRENLEATRVATVTREPRLVMEWNGKKICDISREFLNSNGAEKHTAIEVGADEIYAPEYKGSLNEKLSALVSDLNVCS
ncbi:MAG: phosphoribosylformylglycinamidine synthase, partial [Ruminococcaceae bacterium]|nr:phosphoribosylformylglycinamidine synthase [Oscillospiraceae bacterium]